METKSVITALGALAQAIFRYLVQVGPEGSAASKIGGTLDIAPWSLSFHMKELSHAGLVASKSEGRFVIYAANYTAMNNVLGFLTENCCGGNVCSPVSACCEPAMTKK